MAWDLSSQGLWLLLPPPFPAAVTPGLEEEDSQIGSSAFSRATILPH
jgi:hypothetical protein